MRYKTGLIGAVKAGQKWLQWDDNTYRQALKRLAGKDSATKCSLKELEDLREYMHQQGFPRTKSARHGRRPSVAGRKESTLSKIEALLTDAGRQWGYAEAIAQHMFNIRYIDWLDDTQLIKLMQALIVDAKRRNKTDTL